MESCDLKAGKLGQLDLNAPFLSTRRLFGFAGGENSARRTHEAPVPSSGQACRSVPFLWEAVPGVPKEADRWRDRDEAFDPPRPPPGRWRPPREGGCGGNDNDSRRRDGDASPDESGDDGDVDSGRDGGDHSDTADMVSLSNSLSVACSLRRVDGGFDVVDVEEGGELGRAPSPGFMMQRFLPAAEALAASFAPNASRNPPRRAPRPPPARRHHHPRRKMTTPAKAGLQLGFARQSHTRSYSSSKACGITVFFPWGFKEAFCGFKSSVHSRASFDKQSHGPSGGTHDGNGRHSFRSEVDTDNGSGEVHRTWDTPGWGLRFLDCHGCEGVAVDATGCERGGGRGLGKTAWSLPPLRSPSEPWLAQALGAINKKNIT